MSSLYCAFVALCSTAFWDRLIGTARALWVLDRPREGHLLCWRRCGWALGQHGLPLPEQYFGDGKNEASSYVHAYNLFGGEPS